MVRPAAEAVLEPSADTFWQDAYGLRRLADGRVACPDCLRPLAPHMLAAGKSAILLRHSGNKDRRWVLGLRVLFIYPQGFYSYTLTGFIHTPSTLGQKPAKRPLACAQRR